MKYREVAHAWRLGDTDLLGVASLPATANGEANQLGLLIVVGGPQYRVGSHRQFVLLARQIAAAGYPVLRFDVRGMGDSGGAPRSFEQLDNDIASAIDALQQLAPSVRRVALWGLCDAASAALLYQHERRDPRVAGLALLNPWVRSALSLAKAQVKHYYLKRLGERAFWVKLFSGRVGPMALTELALNFRRSRRKQYAKADAFQDRMAQVWRTFDGDILLLLSADDLVAQEFNEATRADPQWQQNLARAGTYRQVVNDANHTFSSQLWRSAVEQSTLSWLHKLCAKQSTDTQGARI